MTVAASAAPISRAGCLRAVRAASRSFGGHATSSLVSCDCITGGGLTPHIVGASNPLNSTIRSRSASTSSTLSRSSPTASSSASCHRPAARLVVVPAAANVSVTEQRGGAIAASIFEPTTTASTSSAPRRSDSTRQGRAARLRLQAASDLPSAASQLLKSLWAASGMSSSAADEKLGGLTKWWDESTVAVVTGGNKGIGFFIARRMAREGITTVLTSRDLQQGQAAVEKIKAEGGERAVCHQLDITKSDSINALAQFLEEAYGGIDILVNNAGFAFKGSTFGAEEAKFTIDTNYRGTRAVCERLLPLLKTQSAAGARIVNVSSSAGKLRIVGAPLRAKFDSSAITLNELDALVDDFITSVGDGRYGRKGWPGSMYGVSKLAETTYTRILARQLAGEKIFVNACCPGYCATDMSSWRGTKSADQGADTPTFLALYPPSSGGFFSERKLVDF